jgi:hypothetical protein
MEAFKTTLITSIGAFLIGAASAAPRLALSSKIVNSDSAFKASKARVSHVGFPMACVDRADGDPDAPAEYSPLGIAKINGRRIAIYAFRNGAKLDDVTGQGKGFADVFDRAGYLTNTALYLQRESQLAATNHRICLHARALSEIVRRSRAFICA